MTKNNIFCDSCQKQWNDAKEGELIWLCGDCSNIGDGSEYFLYKSTDDKFLHIKDENEKQFK